MAWLNAALAFIVAMILFSTVASAATESLQRIFHLRERGLQGMLARLFEQVIWPRVEKHLATRTTREAARERFVAALTRNRAVDDRGGLGPFGYWFAPRSLAALPTVEFAQRLAETEVGAILQSAGAAQLDAAVDAIARQFERYGADARAYFQQRAKAFSITVAVAVAFALNVDAVRLFTMLVINPDVTAQLIAHGHARTSGPPSDAPPAVSPGGAEPAAAPAMPPAGDAPVTTVGGHGEPGSDAGAELAAGVDAVRDTVATAMAFNLPIGFHYFPWCDSDGVDPACATYRDATDARVVWTLWGRWVLFTLLSGLLIGMGGPFWFDTFVRLSSFVQGLGAITGGNKRDTVQTESAPAAPFIRTPATPAEAFRTAAPSSVPPSNGHPPHSALSSAGPGDPA